MATQQDSNELRVVDADIEADLEKGYNIDLATATFKAEEMERALNGEASSSSDGGAATGAKVTFEDGKAANIVQRMVPITQTMQTPAGDLDDKKKAAIKEKADKSKAEKEKADKARESIGE